MDIGIARYTFDNGTLVPDGEVVENRANYFVPPLIQLQANQSVDGNTLLQKVVRPDLFGDTQKYCATLTRKTKDLSSIGLLFSTEQPTAGNIKQFTRDVALNNAKGVYIGSLVATRVKATDPNDALVDILFGVPVYTTDGEDKESIYGEEPQNQFEERDSFLFGLTVEDYGQSGEKTISLVEAVTFAGTSIVIDRIRCAPFGASPVDPAVSPVSTSVGKLIHAGLFMGFDRELGRFKYAIYINGTKYREGFYTPAAPISEKYKPYIGVGLVSTGRELSYEIAVDVGVPDPLSAYTPDDYAMPRSLAYHVPSLVPAPELNTPTIEDGPELAAGSDRLEIAETFFQQAAYTQYPSYKQDGVGGGSVNVVSWGRPLDNSPTFIQVGDFIESVINGNVTPQAPRIFTDTFDKFRFPGTKRDVTTKLLPVFGTFAEDGNYREMGSYQGIQNWDNNTRTPSLLAFAPIPLTADYGKDADNIKVGADRARLNASYLYNGFGLHPQVATEFLFNRIIVGVPITPDDPFTGSDYLNGDPVVTEIIRGDFDGLDRIFEGIPFATRLRGTKLTAVYNGLGEKVKEILAKYADKNVSVLDQQIISTVVDADNHRIKNCTGSQFPDVTTSLAKIKE